MRQTNTTKKRADYGVDAPGVQLRFLIFGVAGVAAGVTLIVFERARAIGFARSFAAPSLSIGVAFLLTAGLMF